MTAGPVDDSGGVILCELCGNAAAKRCSACKVAQYCCQEHQRLVRTRAAASASVRAPMCARAEPMCARPCAHARILRRTAGDPNVPGAAAIAGLVHGAQIHVLRLQKLPRCVPLPAHLARRMTVISSPLSDFLALWSSPHCQVNSRPHWGRFRRSLLPKFAIFCGTWLPQMSRD